MIYNLRRKFIKICTISFLLVFFCIFTILLVSNYVQMNRMVDTLTDMISENNGQLPNPAGPTPNQPDREPPLPDMIDRETKLATRFFTVTISQSDLPERVNLQFVSSITEEEARNYAEEAAARNNERGWIDDYRYKIYQTQSGRTEIVFVNGSMPRAMTSQSLISAFSVFAISSLAVLTLIILISKQAVRPAAESYEKQQQFITDANHELKTPLTLILTNVDIAESEVGQNEWLDDIRSEGQRMSALVNRLAVLTRMDEEKSAEQPERFCLSDAIEDTVSEFSGLAAQKGLRFHFQIDRNIFFRGNESEIRQVIAILLDNAIKYCDKDGWIHASFQGRRHSVFIIENAYSDVKKLKLDRVFDRFYRADPARTSGSGFGIGLSIAKEIVEKHHGEIKVYAGKEDAIGFRLRF
ncbi:MAG: HAMP domain-containing histidine kinase [Ruminococcus sp.]|nr:HAMP domain-containing histidine kinase [Ruminococcus sp.]